MLLAQALTSGRLVRYRGCTRLLKPGERRLIDGCGIRWNRSRPNTSSLVSVFIVGAAGLVVLAVCISSWGAAVEMASVAGVRTIFSTALDRDVYPRHALFWRPRWWPLYAWGLSRTDRIFVQHRGQLSGLPKRWQSKAYIVPSIAGETAVVKPHCEREKYVAWIAVLREVKRADLLIQIARKMPDVRFVVCGGPSSFASSPGYGERIVKELRAVPNIDFRGPVAPDVAHRVIADAAVFLSTSDEEGFPNTFLQAWASGTPVVSLKIDPDLVIEQKQIGTVSRTTHRGDCRYPSPYRLAAATRGNRDSRTTTRCRCS